MFKNILNTSFFKILIAVISIVQIIIITRTLGIDGRGQTVYLYSLIALIGTIFNFGIVTSAPYFIKKKLLKSQDIKNFFIFYILILTLFFFFVFSLLKTQVNYFDGNYIYLFTCFFFWSVNYFNLGLDVSQKKFYIFNYFSLIKSLLLLLIIVYFYFLEILSVKNYIKALVFSEFISFIYYIYYTKFQINLKFINFFNVIKKIFFEGLKHFPNSIIAILNGNGLNLIIEKFLGTAQLGIFSIASIFYKFSLNFIRGVAAVIYGYLLKLKTTKNKINLIQTNIGVINTINLLIILMVIFFGKYLLMFFFKMNSDDIHLVSIILTFIIFFSGQTVMLQNFILSKGDFMTNTKYNFVASLFFIFSLLAISSKITLLVISVMLLLSKILLLILLMKKVFKRLNFIVIKIMFNLDIYSLIKILKSYLKQKKLI